MAILNSKLVWYYLTSICVVRSGGYIEVKPQYFEQIPLHSITEENKRCFIEKADQTLSLSKEFQEICQSFQRTVQRKFELEVLPGKLQNWHLLTYDAFIVELGKKKIKLSLTDEAKWAVYFLQESKKAMELKSKIEVVDREINLMVYALYELTD